LIDDDDDDVDFWSNWWNEFGRENFVHHKIPHDDPVSNTGPQWWEASD
jgi:hypothetical protein